jgi:hypothetical protein
MLLFVLILALPFFTTSFGMMSASRRRQQCSVNPLQSTTITTMLHPEERIHSHTHYPSRSEIFDVEDWLYDFPQQEVQSSELSKRTENNPIMKLAKTRKETSSISDSSSSSSTQSLLVNREEAMYRKRKGSTSLRPNLEHTVFAKSNQLQSEATISDSQKTMIDVRETGMDSVRSYMKTMCRHELLNKNEEIILAREIQILSRWEKQRDDLEAKLLRSVQEHDLRTYILE